MATLRGPQAPRVSQEKGEQVTGSLCFNTDTAWFPKAKGRID